MDFEGRGIWFWVLGCVKVWVGAHFNRCPSDKEILLPFRQIGLEITRSNVKKIQQSITHKDDIIPLCEDGDSRHDGYD